MKELVDKIEKDLRTLDKSIMDCIINDRTAQFTFFYGRKTALDDVKKFLKEIGEWSDEQI